MDDQSQPGASGGNKNVRVYDRPAMADGLPRWVLVIIIALALIASSAGAYYFLAGVILLGML